MKLWALNVCVACILAGALEMLLPRRESLKSIKTVLALYILVSVVSFPAAADWQALLDLSFEAAQPADYSAYLAESVEARFAADLEEKLARQGVAARVELCAGQAGEPGQVIVRSDQSQAAELARRLLEDTEYAVVAATPAPEGEDEN